MDQKPFVFGVATSGDNFTDREQETARLLANFRHGINTILISPRRWGKTSLVRKVGSLAEDKQLKIVHLDIFSCRTETEFFEQFASAVLRQTSSILDEWLSYAKSFLSRVNPQISVGLDSMTDFSLSLNLKTPDDKKIEDILNLPERIASEKNIRIVICIDEFQQIADFRDSKTLQKLLRSAWQLQKRVSYCLFGSKKHLMAELFEKRSLPFYKFGDIIHLPKIAPEYWVSYICQRFEATGKTIREDLALQICTMVECHSSYVQQLSWLVWVYTDKEASESELSRAIADLISQNSLLFERQTESLGSVQLNLLRAIAQGVTRELSHQEVIQKYNLSSSSHIAAAKKALIKKEMIDSERSTLSLPDPVFALWIRQHL